MVVVLPPLDNVGYRIRPCSILVGSSKNAGRRTGKTIGQRAQFLAKIFPTFHRRQTHQRVLHVRRGVDCAHVIDRKIVADDILGNRFQLTFRSIIERIDRQPKHQRAVRVAKVQKVVDGRTPNAVDPGHQRIVRLFLQQIVGEPDFHLFRVNIHSEDFSQHGID